MAAGINDIRFGLRALKANPSFVVLSVLCLGIGIGASTMTFTAVNGVLLKPLGSVDADGLVAIWEAHQSAPDQWLPASWPNVLDWRASVAERAEISALRGASFALGPDESGARVDGAYITDNLFTIFGVAPVLGRGLQPGDTEAGSVPVAILGERFWRQQFAGDRSIIGRTLQIDSVPHTIVGVVPDLLDIGMPRDIRLARIWLPLRADAGRLSREDRSLAVFARIGSEVSVESFAERLDETASVLAVDYPENSGWSVRVATMAGGPVDATGAALLISLGAASLVLFIACANVANLTLAYAMRRKHEFGIRTAIGASFWMIARQLLSESLVIAVLGAVLGWFISRSALSVFVRLYETDTLAPAAMSVDGRAVMFAVGVTLLTAVLCGLFPAISAARTATRAQLAESTFGTTATRRHDRLRSGLVIVQIAASLVLLIGAALLSRSLLNMLALDGGVETETVTSIRVELLEEPASRDEVGRHVSQMLDALSAIPGVEAAATSGVCLPLRGCGFRSRAAIVDGLQDPDTGPVVAYTGATPGLFDTLKIPVLRGAVFVDEDTSGSLAVINESLASLLWPDQDPIGQQFRLAAEPERGSITVAGVARDFLTWDSSRDRPVPTAFMHVASFDTFPLFFFIRASSVGRTITTESIRRAIESLDVSVRRIVVTPMARVARDPFWRQQVFSWWFAVFGVAALTLTAVGIYGVLSFLVGQRAQEIGIRMALGANRRNVLRMVLRQGAVLAAAGTLIGLIIAFLLARTAQGLLFGIQPLDSGLFAIVTLFLLMISLIAMVVPALRATCIDPNSLLRT